MTASELVKQFHAKHGHPIGEDLKSLPPNPKADQMLAMHAYSLMNIAKGLELLGIADLKRNDQRLYRAHLMVEELAETIEALGKRDEVLLLDGLCDTKYTVVGTAVCYGLPIEEGFVEVHKSNMSKSKRIKSDMRQRRKTGKYFPPDLKKVLARHRGRK